MAQIITKFIADNAVDNTKVRLPNQTFLRGRNQANAADISILKVNGSDRVEFGSIPQYPAGVPTPTQAADVTSKAYVDAQIQNSASQFYRDPVVVRDNVSATQPTGVSTIDGVTINDQDAILFTALTNPTLNNRVYKANVTAGLIVSYTIRIDNDPTGAPLNGDTLWVSSGTWTGHRFTYNGTSFVITGVDTALQDGDSIDIGPTGRINISLAAVSGLESTNPGNPAGQLRVKVEASNPTLKIDGSNQLGVNFTTGSALATGASGLFVQLESVTPTLQIATNQLGVKFSATTSALQTSASGLGVLVEATNPTLKIDGSNHLAVNFAALTSGLQQGAAGLSIHLEATNPTFQINGSGELGAKLNSAGAIVTSATGLLVQLQASNPTLAIGSNQLGVKFSATTSALVASASGLGVQLEASNPSLQIDGSNQLGLKFSATTSGLQSGASGVSVHLEATSPTLAVNGSGELLVKYSATTSGFTQGASGLAIKTDATGDATTAVDGATGELRTPRERFEVLTLNGTDITNQYKDLARLAQAVSVDVIVAGVEQTSGIDYSFAPNAGVTRITFLGDLATGGPAALVSGDVIYIRYRSYTN